MKNSIYLKIFITVFLLVALHASPQGPQNARYTDFIESLVDFGTFALQKDYQSHVDIVSVGGKFYSVIPPGIPLILAPLYFIYRTVAVALGIRSSEAYWGIFSIITTIFVIAPLLGLVSVLMFKTLNRLTEDISKKLWLVFIFIFGSLIFFYSTYGIWSHVYTMSFIFIAFYLILTKKSSVLVGLSFGLAHLVDYAAPVPLSLLGGFWAYTTIKDRSRNIVKEFILLLLGYLILFSVLMYYNYTITGSVFQTPSSVFHKDISMFSFPSLERLWGLTFSPYRGIFLYFPMTFLFVYFFINRSFVKNSKMIFCLLYFVFMFLFNSTYFAWSGDVCFGPRHLVTTIPFIIIPLAYCPIKYIKLLGIVSIFINLAGVSTVPSDNLFVNLAMFLYRGLFLQSQDYLYKVILPNHFNIHISLMTPFFIYLAIAAIIYLIWKPNEHEGYVESIR